MAQAVFDEHPLKQYLCEAGEGLEIMPGLNTALALELESFLTVSLTEDDAMHDDSSNSMGGSEREWMPQFLIYLLHNIETLIATAQLTKPTNPLVERFKYNIISSSLLSPDLPTPHASGQTRHPYAQHHSIPGTLPHSRTSSELSQDHHHPIIPTSCPSDSVASEAQLVLLSGLVVLFAALLSAGLTRLAILTLWTGFAGIYYLRVQSRATRLVDLTPYLGTLDELISINANWETIIQEAITVAEKEECILSPSILPSYGSPTSSLRVALHSTLQTTQTQCDNVRHLLSALTSPSDLSQLSEMYAPPSPQKQNFSFHDVRASKSFSLPSSRERRPRPTSIPTPPSPSAVIMNFTDQKRRTWNGSHSNGSFSSPPMTPITKRRIRYRSDLSTLLGTSASSSASFSAPVTPTPLGPLARVSEDKHGDGLDLSFIDSSYNQSHGHGDIEGEEHETPSFGVAALKFHRIRTANVLENILQPAPVSPVFSPPGTCRRRPSANSSGNYVLPTSPRSSFVSSSRYTTIHTPRQPLSLSALRNTLQAALGAKRYACAHLLALRFHEEDIVSVLTPTAASIALCSSSLDSPASEAEGTYWDDVKSIMELLISALSDSTSRLCAALRETEAMRLRDQTPTPKGSIDAGTGASTSPEIRKLVLEKEATEKRKRLSEMIPPDLGSTSLISFAPMPSQLSRFAGHVAAMQGALEDAGGYLEECVTALNDSGEPSVTHPSSSTRSKGEMEIGDHPALRAYEKLRRELGFALRECERGRNRLLDMVKLPDLDPEGEDSEGTPGLGHDSLSEESDKAGVISPSHSEDGVKDNVAVFDTDEEMKMDGAAQEFLLSTDVDHLPPAHSNPEQVFETDTSVTSSTPIRPRSKLSREERIKLIKARRESGLDGGTATGAGLGVRSEPSPVNHGIDDLERGYGEKWGPGGDVVQELKDVIWKVGERRRKIQPQEPASRHSQPFPSLQYLDGNTRTSPSFAREPTPPSSLDTFNSPPNSGLTTPSNRVISSPRAVSPQSSLDLPSLIPRRPGSMSMRHVLTSLQKEVNEAVVQSKDAEVEECILSSE